MLLDSVLSFLLKIGNNSEDDEQDIFDGIRRSIMNECAAYLSNFVGTFITWLYCMLTALATNGWNVEAGASIG